MGSDGGLMDHSRPRNGRRVPNGFREPPKRKRMKRKARKK